MILFQNKESTESLFCIDEDFEESKKESNGDFGSSFGTTAFGELKLNILIELDSKFKSNANDFET